MNIEQMCDWIISASVKQISRKKYDISLSNFQVTEKNKLMSEI